MNSLEKKLSSVGYHVINVNYPSTSHPISHLATTYISEVLEGCADFLKVHFVTHSMGGILTRYYLKYNEVSNLGNVVMLGPPNKGSEVVDKLRNFFLFKWIFGKTGSELSTDSVSTPNLLGKVNFSLGIIAGNRFIEPLGALFLPSPHDGKVSVESTKVEGMKDHLVLEVSHTFMTQNEEVLRQVKHFLEHTSFDR